MNNTKLRNSRLIIRMTAEERDRLKADAKQTGLTESEFVRQRILNSEWKRYPSANQTMRVICELQTTLNKEELRKNHDEDFVFVMREGLNELCRSLRF